MFYQTLFSPQVKPCAIIAYKHSINELFHKLPINLRLRILGNQEISEGFKTAQNNSLVPCLPAKWNFVYTSKNLLKNEITLLP